MARLPKPGSDQNKWGTILNDFLLQAHNADGTLKNGSVTGSMISPGSIGTSLLQNGAVTVAKISQNTGTDGQVLARDSTKAGGLAWVSPSGGGGVTTLGGDLSGTTSTAQIIASAVTTTKIADGAVTDAKITGPIAQNKVANLATTLSGKEPTISAGTTSQYWRGDKSWQTLDKVAVGLANVDNTSDLAKPISTATQTALNQKLSAAVTITGTSSVTGGGDLTANRTLSLVGDAAAPGNSRYYGTDASGAKGFHAIPATDPTLGGDLSGTASSAQIRAGTITDAEVSATAAIAQSKIANLSASLAAKADTSLLGAPSGIATLDASGKVPASQLPASSGEANTASNAGTSGVGIYRQKTGVDLEFKKLRAGSTMVTVVDDTATNTVAIDVAPANFNLTKANVGLANVDNTSDLAKPISTATQAALDQKISSSTTISGSGSITGGGDLTANRTLGLVGDATTPGNSRYYGTNDTGVKGFHAIPAADPVLGGDLSGTASNAQISAGTITDAEISATAAISQTKIANLSSTLSTKENTISAGTTSQYWRGDKSWQTLDKAAVGLANVDNTSDANKPISTATQAALDGKMNTVTLATVATTGSYTDLTNKPTIPNIIASDTAPANPTVGDMWVDTSG